MTEEIKARIAQEVDEDIPLSDRIDLPRLKAALEGNLYMNDFLIDRSNEVYNSLPDHVFNECGTIGCIAGNAVLNELPIGRRYESDVDNLGENIATIGRRILGLTGEEAEGKTGTAEPGIFYLIYPDHSNVGAPVYNDEVRDAVKVWLKDRGVEW